MIDSLIKAIRAWGESGDTATPESAGIDRANGWEAIYSQARASGGKAPERTVFNRLLLEITTALVALRDHGASLEWDAEVSYIHPAFVFGSDGNPYISRSSSTNRDPTSSQGSAAWSRLNIPASPSNRGLVELATAAEAIAGIDNVRAVTPAGLLAFANVLDIKFMTASGAYTAPAQARRFLIVLTGGGAGGNNNYGGHAGGSLIAWHTANAQLPRTQVTIGGGGASGSAGGNTTFGNLYTAPGGMQPNNTNASGNNWIRIRGGADNLTQAGDYVVGGASIWGGAGAFGASRRRNSAGLVVDAAAGMAIIVAMR